jgi:hypothetical protein
LAGSEKPTAAFVLSLVAGIFVLLGGGAMAMMGSFIGYYGYGMMGGYWRGMIGSGLGMVGLGFGLMGILGLIFGVILVISALMLNNKPQEHATWGSLIVLLIVLSIFTSAMGGFGVGLILGLVGGILAITWKPPEPAK